MGVPVAAGDPRRTLGAAGEDAVAAWYVERGYRIVARNWRIRGGEIDVIATNGRVLVMCEVKTRTSERFGTGLEAVTVAKQQRLRRLGAAWLAQADPPWRGPVRFDVAALLVGREATTLRVVEGAF